MKPTNYPARDLSQYHPGEFTRGAGLIKTALWYVVSAAVFETPWFPLSRIKRTLLRWFGAQVGDGVVIKPQVRIKFPWRLSIGEHTWIGQEAWIDNLAEVSIGAHCCVSQGVYLCTGSHDIRRPHFDLITLPIVLDDQSWVCAKAVILPGVTIGQSAIVSAGSVISRNVPPQMVASTHGRPQLRPLTKQNRAA